VYVEPTDTRPPSLLRGGGFSPAMIVGGIVISAGTHLATPAALALILSAFALVGAGQRNSAPAPQDVHVVEARFVRLGDVFDPKKLPNRRVPRKSTAPDQKTVVSKNPRTPKPQPDAGTPPANAEKDLIARLGDRAQMFAEIAEKREQEGDPKGVEWGTETEGREGDLYRGQLVAFFQRGWSVPTVLSEDVVRRLVTSVVVEITAESRVGDYKVVRPSEEPLFDQSVTNRLQELRQSGTTIPQPPPDVASQFIGKEIRIDFNGRNAR
jgi:outer membrane biosynthesis protein TonB